MWTGTGGEQLLSRVGGAVLIGRGHPVRHQFPVIERLYLRDTELVTTLTDGDAAAVLDDLDREADLARVAAFNHTIWFAYRINALRGHDVTPSVQYWRGREGNVGFVFGIYGTHSDLPTPVPVGLAYRPGDREASLEALREFTDTYDVPLGLLLAGDTVRGSHPIEDLGAGIVRLPYWLYLLLC